MSEAAFEFDWATASPVEQDGPNPPQPQAAPEGFDWRSAAPVEQSAPTPEPDAFDLASARPLTESEQGKMDDENFRRLDYVMPPEEYNRYWDYRDKQDREVGRFLEGLGQGAVSMLGMIPEAGREIRDGMVGMVTDPVNQVQRNVQTGAEVIRKAGINLVQLYDWVSNKYDDLAESSKRAEAINAGIRQQLQDSGALTGDRGRDEQIYQAALVEAREAGAYKPTAEQAREDRATSYERYVREKALEQEFAKVTQFQIGQSPVTAPSATAEAYQITDEQPAETLSTIGAMAVDPLNLVPLGAGALTKVRALRRIAKLSEGPLEGLGEAAAAGADAAKRLEFRLSSRIQDLTGLTDNQQVALSAGMLATAGAVDYATDGNAMTKAVALVGAVLPAIRFSGGIMRTVSNASGGAATIVREAGVGGVGVARAEAAASLSGNAAVPERYRKFYTGYMDGTDSTLKRVSQDAANPDGLRRAARFADRVGVTQVARATDDAVSGALTAGVVGVPFAALQPDAERAGEVLGGVMALGAGGGAAGGMMRRRGAAVDADIARMLADVQAIGGNVEAFARLPHATLDRFAAMQGVLASKVDFIPLTGEEFKKHTAVPTQSAETTAGYFLEKDGTGRARILINLDGNRSAESVVPHEIGHAILTSNVLDGQPRNDLRNLVNQQYGPEGVAERGREYVAQLVDAEIKNGLTGEAAPDRNTLIDQRFEEFRQRSIERGQDALDWARDEIIAETFASEAPAIDFRAIRRDAAFPRLAESMLAAGGRVLEMMGVRLDSGTGKMLDNPSVLFRDNPLFQDRIMQRRVKEYVRAYDQYLSGLEEAGSATPRGVELARSSRPEDLGRSTHVKLRDEGRGVLENDFLFQRPDGTYSFKPQKIINAAEANRAAQIKTLYDARKFVPVNSTEFGKRKVNGREVIGGPVLPPQFDLFTQFPQHVREFARAMEASRAEGGSWNIDYNAIGTGSSGRYRITNMGAVRAIQRETVPFGWQVTKQNHLLAASLDLNAFRAAAMKAINKGELGIFNNDMRQVEADLKTYLANHRNGLPGEATIGQQKRDTLNGLIGTGTAVQRAANPLYAELNPKGSIRTWRIDRLNDAQPSGRTGYFFDYDKINNNRMPQQIPREAQGMPDAPASGRGDGMPEDYTLSRLRDLQERYEKDLTEQDVIEEMDFILSDAPAGYFPDSIARQVERARQDISEQYSEWGGRDDLASVERAVDSVMRFIDRKNKPSAAPRGQAMPDVAAQDAFEYAKRRHGTTRSIYEAGYVLPDGTMLDFSGKSDAGGYERKADGNFGPQQGQPDYLRDTRNSDHREIRFSESQDFGGNEAMTEFMRKGAVRVDANSGLISIHGRQRLTSAQKGVIKDIVRSQDGAWLDLEDDAGNRTSLELKSGKWAPVEGLLNQWADGKTPRPRAQFMPDAAIVPTNQSALSTYAPGDRLPPNTALVNLVNNDGQVTALVGIPYDGTEQGLIRAHAQLDDEIAKRYEWRRQYTKSMSQRGGTDAEGNPAYVVSANLKSVAAVGTPQARYILGDLAADPGDAPALPRPKRSSTASQDPAGMALDDINRELDDFMMSEKRLTAKQQARQRALLAEVEKRAGKGMTRLPPMPEYYGPRKELKR